jgi:hypothetical protein
VDDDAAWWLSPSASDERPSTPTNECFTSTKLFWTYMNYPLWR